MRGVTVAELAAERERGECGCDARPSAAAAPDAAVRVASRPRGLPRALSAGSAPAEPGEGMAMRGNANGGVGARTSRNAAAQGAARPDGGCGACCPAAWRRGHERHLRGAIALSLSQSQRRTAQTQRELLARAEPAARVRGGKRRASEVPRVRKRGRRGRRRKRSTADVEMGVTGKRRSARDARAPVRDTHTRAPPPRGLAPSRLSWPPLRARGASCVSREQRRGSGPSAAVPAPHPSTPACCAAHACLCAVPARAIASQHTSHQAGRSA